MAVGVSRYLDFRRLDSVVNDVDILTRVLTQVGYVEAFPGGLINPRRPDDLKHRIGDWVRSADRGGDSMILYYSGHGQRDEGRGRHFLLCTDSETGALGYTAVATDDLVQIIVDGGVRRLLVILDTCEAAQGSLDAIGTIADHIRASVVSRVAKEDRLVAFALIAAARTREEATEGAFTDAFRVVMRDQSMGGRRQPYLRLDDIVEEVNKQFEKGQLTQRAVLSVLLQEHRHGFIPNIRFTEDLPSELDIAEATVWASPEAVRRREDIRIHFEPRGRGTDVESGTGHYFSGRVELLTMLAGWLRREVRNDTSALLLTGAPGTGKSAVLGRLVTRSDRRVRHTIPDATVPLSTDVPIGTIDTAIHARRLSLNDILLALTESTGIKAISPQDFVDQVRARQLAHTVVIDALDEAGTTVDDPGERRRLTDFLVSLSRASPKFRLLVGARPSMRESLAHGFTIVDLDDTKWTNRLDLATYAAALLMHPHGEGSVGCYSDEAAYVVAGAIGRRAFPNYLVARLTSRALAVRDAPLDTAVEAWDSTLPAVVPEALRFADPIGPAFRWAMREHLGHEADRAREILRPLAYAEGAGLPWRRVWSGIATALSERLVDQSEITWAMNACAPYVIESLDAEHRSVYRLYHQGLSDNLRLDAPENAQRRISDSLIAQVPLSSPSGKRDWERADPYILTHLSAHAEAAGALDTLLLDPEFLIHANPVTLIPHLRRPRGSIAERFAAVYRTSAHLHRHFNAAARRQMLSVDAARHGTRTLMNAVTYPEIGEGLRWQPSWATGGQTSSRIISTIETHGEGIQAVATILADERRLIVTGDRSGYLHFYYIEDGMPFGSPLTAHQSWITAIICTTLHGRATVITAGRDRAVRIWDLNTRQVISETVLQETEPTALAEVRLGRDRVVLVGGEDGTVRYLSLEKGTEIGDPVVSHKAAWPGGFPGYRGGVTTLATGKLSSRQAIFVTGGGDGGLHLWDLKSRALLRTLHGSRDFRLDEGIRSVVVTAWKRRTIAVAGGDDGKVEAWDIETGERIGRPFVATDSADSYKGVLALSCFRSRGSLLAVVCGVGRVWLCDVEQGTQVGSPLGGHVGRIWASACTKSWGQAVAVTVGDDRLVRVWRISSGTVQRSMAGHTGYIYAARTYIADKGDRVVTLSSDGTLQIRDVVTGALVGVITPENKTASIQIAQLGSCKVVVLGAHNGKLSIWDLETQTLVPATWSNEDRKGQYPELASASSIAVTEFEGSSVLVTGGMDGSLRTWNLETRALLRRRLNAHEEWIRAISFAQVKGRRVIVTAGFDGKLRMWDLLRLSPLGSSIVAHNYITALTTTLLDGLPVAVSGGDNGIIRVWDLVHRVPLTNIQAHLGKVNGIRCAPFEGRKTLFTGGDDGQVMLWDLKTGVAIDSFALPGSVGALALGMEGEILACFGWEVTLLSQRSSDFTRRVLRAVFESSQ